MPAQYMLQTRIRGPLLASHGCYHDVDYFRAVTGIRRAAAICNDRTDTHVRCMSPALQDANVMPFQFKLSSSGAA